MTIKFPFVYLSDEDIQSISFNSNFPCKCQKTLPSHINQPIYVFEYTFRQHDDGKENNIIDYNDQQLDNLRVRPDFKYYQNHEFYKLSQNLKKNKTLSILHTNICSLEGNAEELETLIPNLEFK